ncbi:hypothetical protein OPKNFCMD_3054 [Methylobacterium crusticola]|uniref:Histidine kinase n=1 Tax=Methylobacterium crusticola TaxID=1697972 RepID=A0ABQ4QZM5_9HYPH|nr:hypothetical protein [Methylobacterium crusticola]GJD50315.1 hypothetical protein OPKNFCMD_3054 [Methylobacterium crusticola]
MRPQPRALAGLLLLAASPARADDASACREGIAMIREELGKGPAEPLQRGLRRSLRVAEREQGEGEFDECLDAVRAARKALGR